MAVRTGANDAIKRLDEDGNLVWVFTDYDFASQVQVGPDEQAITGGRDKESLKIDADGGEVWSSFLPDLDATSIFALAINEAGNFWTGGNGPVGKYTPDATTLLWQVGLTTESFDEIGVDVNDRMVGFNEARHVNIWDTDGTNIQRWEPQNLDLDPTLQRVKFGSDLNSVFVAYARNIDSIHNPPRYMIEKYEYDGTPVWSSNDPSVIRGITVDREGNVFTPGQDGWLRKHRASNGTIEWAWDSGDNIINASVAPDGFIYVTFFDIFSVKKISPSGSNVWGDGYTGHTSRITGLSAAPGEVSAFPTAWDDWISAPTDLTVSPDGDHLLASWSSTEEEFILQRWRWNKATPPPT